MFPTILDLNTGISSVHDQFFAMKPLVLGDMATINRDDNFGFRISSLSVSIFLLNRKVKKGVSREVNGRGMKENYQVVEGKWVGE